MFFFFCFMAILFLLAFKMNHLLSFLVIYEILGVYFIFTALGSFMGFSYFYLLLFFLAFSVCESVVGLVFFIFYCRNFSKDYLHGLNLLKF